MTEDIPPAIFGNTLLTHQGDDHPSNLISHTSNSGNLNPRPMISMSSQRQQRSLDTTLRGIFGYTPRRGLLSIAKRPGNKYGFRLSSYIHANDPPGVVRSVLERIRDLQYYETSPIVGMLTRELKSTLRKEYLARQQERSRTFVVGDLNDKLMGPGASAIILTIMKQFPGKHIQIVAYNRSPTSYWDRGVNSTTKHTLSNLYVRNPIVDSDIYSNVALVNVDGTNSGIVKRHAISTGRGDLLVSPSGIGDHSYHIPRDNKAINNFFRGDNGIKPFYDWMLQYSTNGPILQNYPVPFLNEGDVIKVYVIEDVAPLSEHRSQSFAQGINHCLIQPIINDLSAKRDVAKSSKSFSNYKRAVEVLQDYEQKYKDGIPEEILPLMVEDVSKKGVQINIEITLPLATTNQFISIKNSYGHGKLYKFLNTRLDHVDLNSLTLQNIQSQGRHKTFEIIDVTREEIVQIQHQHFADGKHCEWVCGKSGVTKLWSTTQVWKCHVDYSDTVVEFENKADLHRLMIDHINDKDLSEFILSGTHYCGSVLFQEPPDDRANLQCFDIHKSYAKPQDCRFYNECKFPYKITRFSPTDSIQGPGLYLITNLDWTYATPKFVEINRLEGYPIRDNNVYAVPILKLLDFHRVKYTVVMGSWAGGQINTYDLKFSDDIIEKKFYPMLVGKWNSTRETTSYYMCGSQELAGHILRYAPNATAEWRPMTRCGRSKINLLEYERAIERHLCYRKAT